jgi:hypothetical protein
MSITIRRTGTALALAALAVGVVGPASAATTWFAAAVTSPIANGAGPGPAPRAAATADFNGDGHPDIVSIGNFTFGDVLVSPGLGNGQFATATAISGTAQTQGLDAGDVTGDGAPDVVAMTTSDVKILKGDGAGGFTTTGTYSLTLGGQVQPLIVDLDGDGDNDIVAPTFTAIQTLLNTGSGSFVTGPTTQVSGASVLAAISIAHLDPGSTPDLFTVDGFSGTTFALTGTGTGAFQVKGQLYATGFVPEDVASIDLDGDGFDDVATIGSFSFSVTTALTDGTGKFRSSTIGSTTYAGPGPTSANVADFDEDGREDLVISSLANPAQGTLTVLAGNGTTSLTNVGTASTAAFPQNPLLADYDEDGRTDIAVVSPGSISFLSNTAP